MEGTTVQTCQTHLYAPRSKEPAKIAQLSSAILLLPSFQAFLFDNHSQPAAKTSAKTSITRGPVVHAHLHERLFIRRPIACVRTW